MKYSLWIFGNISPYLYIVDRTNIPKEKSLDDSVVVCRMSPEFLNPTNKKITITVLGFASYLAVVVCKSVIFRLELSHQVKCYYI